MTLCFSSAGHLFSSQAGVIRIGESVQIEVQFGRTQEIGGLALITSHAAGLALSKG